MAAPAWTGAVSQSKAGQVCRNLDAEREGLCMLEWPSAGMAPSCHIKQLQLENGWGMKCSKGDCALQDLSSSSRRADDLPMWNAEQPTASHAHLHAVPNTNCRGRRRNQLLL